MVNEATYSARMNGRALDLTFKEFELLKFLAQHPGRVFTRAQLLQEVWGYDYFGGTRTVDVHVRRLRAKLGAENEALIGTVRNVGYRFVPVKGAGADGGPSAARRPARCPQQCRLRWRRACYRHPASKRGACRQIVARPPRSRVGGPLTPADAAAVLDLVQHAAEEDGVSPLSEHVMLHLRYGGDPRARNVLIWQDGELAGYGHLDPTDPVEGPAGEMVIDPARRRQGLGVTLGRAMLRRGRQRRTAAVGAWRAAGSGQAGGGRRASAAHQGAVADAPLVADPDRQAPACRRHHSPDVRVGADEDAWVAPQSSRIRTASRAGRLDQG